MAENIKVRVTQGYNDVKLQKYITAVTIRFIDYQRTRELDKLGVIKVMEIRKCKYE